MFSVWLEVCSILGIFQIQTTSFHPQNNGMIKRFNRSLKSALRTCLAGPDWVHHLPLVMLVVSLFLKMTKDSPQLKLCSALLFLFWVSSLYTLSCLWRFVSRGLIEQFPVSQVVSGFSDPPDIM